jgi:hypothetical protein
MFAYASDSPCVSLRISLGTCMAGGFRGARRGPLTFEYLRSGEIGICGLLCRCPPILEIRGVKAISPGREVVTLPVLEPLFCRTCAFPRPRPPYVVFLPAPGFAPGRQSGSLAFSKPRGLFAGRVKLVVFCGEPLVAKAEDALRASVLTVRDRSSSLRSFASLDESGRRRRLHLEVVHGSVSSVDIAINISSNACRSNVRG